MQRPPAELGIDLMSGAFIGSDPFPAYSWMRRNAPVYFDEVNDLWALSRHGDVRAASTDCETFSSSNGIRPKFPPLPMMIDFDTPEHFRRRRLVSSGFTPRRVRGMEEQIRATCDRVIDRVCEIGHCDFVTDIAAPLPLAVIGDMLGVAESDRPDLLRWSEEMLGSQGSLDPEDIDAAARAFVEYTEYMEQVIDARRRSGDDRDLVGILVNAEVDGDRLDHDSVIHETLLILVGGDETTRHVITGGFHALAGHPDQLARLRRRPELIPAAVEEMLRWVSPIKNMARTTTRPVTIAGQALPAGAEILLLYPSANRDEEVFEEPDRFDVARSPNPHLAFGFGAHFCLGNQLARTELRIMFEQLSSRLPDLSLVDDTPPPFRHASFISGIDAMPVTFTPVPPRPAPDCA